MTERKSPPQKVNYQRELERKLEQLEREPGVYPRLLLHSCCGPCSSYVMEYLREHFRLTVFYYNPNITEKAEYRHRLEEEKRLIALYNDQVRRQAYDGMHSTERAQLIDILEAPYDPDRYLEAVRGMEHLPEGGARCSVCFRMRLLRTAEEAVRGGFDYFTTTLTISPLKDAQRLNAIGLACAEQTGAVWLPGDFKKRNGYRRSVELSRQFCLYRQDYCGCVFSREERRRQNEDQHEKVS